MRGAEAKEDQLPGLRSASPRDRHLRGGRERPEPRLEPALECELWGIQEAGTLFIPLMALRTDWTPRVPQGTDPGQLGGLLQPQGGVTLPAERLEQKEKWPRAGAGAAGGGGGWPVGSEAGVCRRWGQGRRASPAFPGRALAGWPGPPRAQPEKEAWGQPGPVYLLQRGSRFPQRGGAGGGDGARSLSSGLLAGGHRLEPRGAHRWVAQGSRGSRGELYPPSPCQMLRDAPALCS